MRGFLLFIIGLHLLLIQQSYSQHTLHVPIDIQQAYINGTRSVHGEPGQNYWQNTANYNLKVSLDPTAKTISGQGTITYFNNSPDTLNRLVVRLYQDLYKKGNFRDFPLAPADIHEGIKIQNLSINNNKVDVNDLIRTGTNLIVPLNDQLIPGDEVHLQISWSYPISQNSTVREGYYKNHDGFFIAYWYPQIAVYDDVWGWNSFNFTGMQEFYNDFNNYEVEISAPKGFVVWATGLLNNPEENLAPKILEKYRLAQRSDQVIAVIDVADYESGPVTADKDTLTWSYSAKNVTDFAFATSDHYLWEASTLKLTDNDVLISAAFDRKSNDFYEVAEISRKSIEFFCKELPAVDYPYPSMTVFNGKGGMEFPMMVNDGSMAERSSTIHVTSHEIAHTYFPFYMGINEQMYAFMDEGWAVMLPFEIQNRLEPTYDPISRTVRIYENAAGKTFETRLMLPSIAISGHVYAEAYRNSAYIKSGLAYYYLKGLLGEELFLKALHKYMDLWKGKHPLPYDFFYTFNEVVGEDLSWFWIPWFFETGHPDLAIQDVVSTKNGHQVTIKNVGNIPVPVELEVEYIDGTSEVVCRSAKEWEHKNTTAIITIKSKKQISSIRLGNTKIPDIVKENNVWKRVK